jgi:prepilin-type N-terminal cleavage/methylation domain-containing protein
MPCGRVRSLRDERGFTLIELLVVLLIVGVLVGLGVAALRGMERRANDAVARHDLVQARVAAQLHFAEAESYTGLTLAALRAVDSSVPARLSVEAASTGSYCVKTTVGGRTWYFAGPGGQAQQTGC